MNTGTTRSDDNPTHSVFSNKGMWLTYVLVVYFVHLLLLSLPFISTDIVWTLTNAIHALVTYTMFHVTKGTPWPTSTGEERLKTQWEQIDFGRQFTPTKKFLMTVPIVLFFVASFYSRYDKVHFFFNLFFLLLTVVPKLPMFHGVRIFNINKW
ncbi:hypothetical protein ACJMK2_023128 [Sinanodonta woodiana]|uniref:ORM1-like protein n=1 Tax=Sinanodonta woodiana TaxID=1069815 RepID=A0ABD3T3U4_SINWO